MPDILKFPFTFDPARLKEDAEKFAGADWIPHFNTGYYEGDWSGVALRSSADAHVALYPDPTANTFVDTEMIARCSYIPDVIRSFKCEMESARLLRLGPGDRILEHRDHKLSFQDGVARVHVPIKTSPHVQFFLDGNEVQMGEGEAWYLNFNLKHKVANEGPDERIHLVLDCIVNEWLAGFFEGT